MATVAATVANGGMRMQPHLTSRVVDADGRTVKRIAPEEAERVISEKSAAQLTQMMANVVREGTGTAAALVGHRGRRQDRHRRAEHPAAPQPAVVHRLRAALEPKVAIAVTLENLVGAQGGTVAAPIAKQVLESLLR